METAKTVVRIAFLVGCVLFLGGGAVSFFVANAGCGARPRPARTPEAPVHAAATNL